MKTKEKTIYIMIIFIILLIICIFYTLYSYKNSSYATTSNDINTIPISKAQKINMTDLLNEKIKQNLEQIITKDIEIEYLTQYQTNNELPKGEIKVKQEGRTGIKKITIKKTYDENGILKNEEQINSIIVKSSVTKIVEVGTSENKNIAKIKKGDIIFSISDRADILKENNLQSEKITTISKYTEMVVIEEKNNWCKINFNGQIGWIKKENITEKTPNIENNEENSKNEINKEISFDMPLNKPSGLTLEQFKIVLSDPKDKNNVFTQNADYFYYIEQQYNINGLFVAAIGIHESAWGTSKISINKRNLFGYGAYDANPYDSSFSFSTYSEGIDLIARVLVKYYLNPNGTQIYNNEIASGKYYNGNTLKDVNKKYATDKNWSNKVFKYMQYLYEKI